MQEKLVRKSSQRGNKELNSLLNEITIMAKINFQIKKVLKML